MKKPWRTHITVPAETRGWGENKRMLPALQAVLEVSINWEKLVQRFGEKAARSKGKRTSMLAGLIKIKCVSTKELP